MQDNPTFENEDMQIMYAKVRPVPVGMEKPFEDTQKRKYGIVFSEQMVYSIGKTYEFEPVPYSKKQNEWYRVVNGSGTYNNLYWYNVNWLEFESDES